jgi:hypothetical protein
MLRHLWVKWKAFAEIVGNFQARVILSIFYFILFFPVGIGIRFFADPLRLRRVSSSNWITREKTEVGLEDSRRQF